MIFRLQTFDAVRRSLALALLGGALLVLGGCAQPGVEGDALSGRDAVRLTGASEAQYRTHARSDGGSLAPDVMNDERRPNAQSDGGVSAVPAACMCDGAFQQTGIATWYGKAFHGRRTASGERYDMHAFTAAHRTLPLGACVRVTALGGVRPVIVRINDRGPFARGRVIDLSYAAAQALGIASSGKAQVKLERLAAAPRCAACDCH